MLKNLLLRRSSTTSLWTPASLTSAPCNQCTIRTSTMQKVYGKLDHICGFEEQLLQMRPCPATKAYANGVLPEERDEQSGFTHPSSSLRTSSRSAPDWCHRSRRVRRGAPQITVLDSPRELQPYVLSPHGLCECFQPFLAFPTARKICADSAWS